MAKKIDMDSVIGNGIIFMDKERLSRGQIYHYIDIVDKLLPEGYYTYGNGDIFDNFCDRYPFIVQVLSFGDEFLVKSDKQTLERYFRIGLPKEIINVFEKSAKILNQIKEQEKLNDSSFDENNIINLRRTIQENKSINCDGKAFRMVESTSPVKVKVNKKSRKNCVQSLLK